MMRLRWAVLGAATTFIIAGALWSSVSHEAADAAPPVTTMPKISIGERAVYVPIPPCRLFDTRRDTTVGARSTPLAAGETFVLPVTREVGNCSFTTSFTGVAMNVTVVNGTADSFLTIWGSGYGERPLASSLNWTAGAPPTPNMVNVDLSFGWYASFYNNAGTVVVIADVVGYFIDHDHDDRYYTKNEIDSAFDNIADLPISGSIVVQPSTFTPLDSDASYHSEPGSGALDPTGTTLECFAQNVFPPDGSSITALRAGVSDGSDQADLTVRLLLHQPFTPAPNWTFGIASVTTSGGGTGGLLVDNLATPFWVTYSGNTITYELEVCGSTGHRFYFVAVDYTYSAIDTP
jgi:hypothetical protein